MAWDFTDCNTSPATGSIAQWTLLARLIANGATQKGSGDGSTWACDGTGSPGAGPVANGGAAATGLGNTTAWVRLQWPADAQGATREILLQRESADTTWSLYYSYSAGFTGGTPDATTRPTATDEQTIYSSEAVFLTNNTYYYSVVAGGASEDYTWFAAFWEKVTGTLDGLQVMDRFGTFVTGDYDPVVFTVTHRASGYAVGSYLQISLDNAGADAPKGWVGKKLGNAGTWGGLCGMSYYSSNTGPFVPRAIAANTVTGKDDTFPIFWVSITGGYKGVSRLQWKGPNRASLSTLSISGAGAKDYVVIGDVAIPWNGADPTT